MLYRTDFIDDATPAGELPILVTSRTHLARSSVLARGLGIAHRRCAAEDHAAIVLRELPLALWEAVLLHWYVIGRLYVRCTGNPGMAARIS
jgi:hypothetical protein